MSDERLDALEERLDLVERVIVTKLCLRCDGTGVVPVAGGLFFLICRTCGGVQGELPVREELGET